MMKKIILPILVVAILLIGGYFLLGNMQTPTSNDNSQNMGGVVDSVLEGDTETKDEITSNSTVHEVIYTDGGYAPAELKIKVGDTVMFKNQSSQQVWTASAMHPTHIVYSGTSLQSHCPDAENDDFDQCEASGNNTSWSFIFNKAGTWAYHNHVVAGKFGKIIAE